MSSSPNKSRFVVAATQQQALNGLKFFTIKNKENSDVIPSTKNYLERIQIRGLKIDQGATISLFPVVNTDALNTIFETFPLNQFIYTIVELKAFGGSSVLAMQIGPVAENANFKFSLYLGCDIYPIDEVVNLKSTESETSITTPITENSLPIVRPVASLNCVHFVLCSEDIDIIRNTLSIRCFFNEDVNSLELLTNYSHEIPRHVNGLLGNDLLAKFASIKYHRVELLFDVTCHRLEAISWNTVSRIVRSILAKKYLRDNIDVDELNLIRATDIIFEESEEFNVDEDEKEV